MFVAVDQDSGKRVTSIAAAWADRLEVLRGRARKGSLRCPGCAQPLWFRVGKKLRPHFAHRQTGSCPLAHDSSEVREAKALLYEWLETKFPGRVELDFDFGIAGNRYPADLVVDAGEGRRFAYWVFDRAKRNRERLFATGEMRGVVHHVIHTESAHDCAGARIHLTASQRDFAKNSRYDAFARPSLGHLHFLDSGSAALRIYRGLHCVHPPAGHGWAALRSGELGAALVTPTTGEIVLAADVEEREAFRKQQKERKEQKRNRRNRRNRRNGRNGRNAGSSPPRRRLRHLPVEEPWEEGADAAEPEGPAWIAIPDRPPLEPRPFVDPPAGDPPAWEEPLLNKPLRCEDCGTMTTDWSQGTPGRGSCVCRDCAAKRHARLRGG